MNSSNVRTQHNAFSFLVFVVFFQASGALMGWITAQNIESWYHTLHRSPLTPPDSLFGVVWSSLYFLLSMSAWLVWKRNDSTARTAALRLFAGHMILNWLWTPLFFVAHALLPSLALIFILIFTAALLAWMIYPLSRIASFAFVPYIGWLIFAGHLADYIWMKN